MSGDNPSLFAEIIVEKCDHDPPNHVDAHPRLFDDLADEDLHEYLFKLWRKGILDAKWDEDDEETEWWMTEFGVELHEQGLVRPYIEATENEIELETGPALRVDPAEVV